MLQGDTLNAIAGFPGHAERRAPEPRHRVAAGIDELRISLQGGIDRSDAVDGSDRVGESDIDRLAGVVTLELLRAADLEIDVLAEFGEQVVERLRQAVGQHERPDDEGDTGSDRDGDGNRATEPGTDAPAGDERRRTPTQVIPRGA